MSFRRTTRPDSRVLHYLRSKLAYAKGTWSVPNDTMMSIVTGIHKNVKAMTRGSWS